MRKVIAGFAASLDGYIEARNGAIDWILIDKEIDFAEQMKRYDAFLLGRKTYEVVLNSSNKTMPGITNYVFSNTLTAVERPYMLLKGDTRKQVQQLKEQDGKDIALFGGAMLLASLLELHLVDEIVVSIIPVLLSSGKPMVAALQEYVWLEYRASKIYSNGTVQLTYNVIYKRH